MSQPKKFTSLGTLVFVVILCFACALTLSVLASALKAPQEEAKELDRSKQMLLAARIFNPNGYFQIKDKNGNYIPAKLSSAGNLVPGAVTDVASTSDIFQVYRKRIRSFLVDGQGHRTSFEKAGLNESQYLTDYRKEGYDRQPYKLVYEILPDDKTSQGVEGYIFHVTGFGLWDAIFGYLAVEPDAVHVIGISWYEHKETPGLGANITEPAWQSQFPEKMIFLPDADGSVNLEKSPIGITVVRGKVADAYPNSPKAKAAVDGMAGATLTGNGVTKAYKDTLSEYRPFLIEVGKDYKKNHA